MPTPAATDPSVLRVATFNLRYDNPADGEDAWKHRKDDVGNYIARDVVPTIIGFQEALLPQIRDLEVHLSEYGWTGRGREYAAEKGEYCVLFYRKDALELMQNGTFWLSERPEDPGSKHHTAKLPRIVHWAQFKQHSTGKIFFVFNTHFDHVGAEARVFAANLLLQKIQVIAGLYPAIVVGDFNAEPNEKTYSILTSYFLKDSALPSASKSRENTFTGFFRESSLCIDYIFTSGFGIRSHNVLSNNRPNGRCLSDHKPVLAECFVNV